MISEKTWTIILSILFLLPWSSGPLVVKLGLNDSSPLTFLGLRFTFACVIFLILSLLTKAAWPTTKKDYFHAAITGIFLQAIYLMACFSVMNEGITPGLFATILGAQPLMTALICRYYFKDSVTFSQWVGLIIGFLGLTIVTLHTFSSGTLTLFEFFLLMIGLVGITVGTLYQKKRCQHIDPRTGCTIQYAVSAPFVFLFAYWLEPLHVHWTGSFIFALSWMVLPISVGAMIVLQLLIKRGEATRVASLFYVVPPLTTVFDYIFYENTLTPTTLIGLFIISVGIFLVNRQPLRARFLPSDHRLAIE